MPNTESHPPGERVAKSPEEQMASMTENLKKATGKSLDQWTSIAKNSGKTKHGEVVTWLKSEHGVTHGYANLIAHSAFKSDAASQTAAGADLVEEMFAGDKAAMRPIFDRIMESVRGFGGDIEESPKKGYLSLRRKTQFATLHPSTKTRFDVGIKLKGVPPAGRLEAAGSWNAMVSHRVRLESANEVDAELIGWIRKAYDAA
jgi:predicted transport protein